VELTVEQNVTKRILRGLRLVGTLFTLSALSASAGQSLSLEWDSSPDPNVVGYRLYYRDLASTNVHVADVKGQTWVELNDLNAASTYSFSVTAYNAVGLESDPSNSIEYTIPLGAVATAVSKDRSGRPVLRMFAQGVTGRRLALQKSADLLNWTTMSIGAVGAPVVYSVTNNLALRKEFYRSVLLP